MVKFFRITAYLEGISLLLLLGIAMPMKYVWGMPLAVKYTGWIHGVLFMLYVAILVPLSSERGWPGKRTALGFLAAVLPFGTFIFDRSLRDELSE